MAYDYVKQEGEYYVSYPHYYKQYVNNEKRFKEFLVSYLKHNEPTSVAVGVTKDLKLVCKKNPNNTLAMVNARRDERKKPKRGAKKR